MSESGFEQQIDEVDESFPGRQPASAVRTGIWLPRQFTALGHRNYRLFFGGQIISLTGTWLKQVAHGWLVLQLTNSALMLGVVSSISALPVLLFALPAGVLADRFCKRKLIIMTQVCSMILALSLALLVYFDVVNIYHVIAMGFCLGLVNALDAPTRHSFVIEMVGRKDLMNAIALNSAMFNSARIIGPAIAGIIIGTMGIAGAFFINGFSYIAVIAGLMLMKVNAPKVPVKESVLHGMREGLAFIRGHRMVTALLTLTAVVSIFAAPYAVLMPIFARDILKVGPGGLGYLMAAAGIGALMGAITLSSLGDFQGKAKLLLAGNLTFCVMITLFSFSRQMPLSLLLLVGMGWGIMTNMALTNTLIQTSVPDRLRGRVMSAYTLMFLGMAPIGSLQAGVLANWLGAPMAVRIGAAVCATVALLLSSRFIRGEQRSFGEEAATR